MMKLFYVSLGLTTHDLRFMSVASEVFDLVGFVQLEVPRHPLVSQQLPPNVIHIPWNRTTPNFSNESLSKDAIELERLISEFDTDVIQAGPIDSVAFLAMSANTSLKPLIATSWATDLMINIKENRRYRARARDVCAIASRTIVDCQTIAQIAVDLGSEAQGVLVVPWGIELDNFPFLPKQRDPTKLSLLSVRAHEPIYNIPLIVEAFSDLRSRLHQCSVELTVVGRGSQTAAIRKRAKDLHAEDAITWCDPVPEADLVNLFRTHDIAISAAKSDGSSISMLQAMAVGCMCVVPNLASNQEWIVDGETGWTYDLNKSGSLALLLEQLASASHELFTIAVSARNTVCDRADWTKNRREIAELYRAVMAQT
jgi:L-malate glycosyltransferase